MTLDAILSAPHSLRLAKPGPAELGLVYTRFQGKNTRIIFNLVEIYCVGGSGEGPLKVFAERAGETLMMTSTLGSAITPMYAC
jgi:hypothetical protein